MSQKDVSSYKSKTDGTLLTSRAISSEEHRECSTGGTNTKNGRRGRLSPASRHPGVSYGCDCQGAEAGGLCVRCLPVEMRFAQLLLATEVGGFLLGRPGGATGHS